MAEAALPGAGSCRTRRRRSARATAGGLPFAARPLAGALCAALSAVLAGPAPAASWEIVPTVTLDETFTDNLRLSAPGAERSDWVTTLSPSLMVRGTGERLRLDLSYSPQFLRRANEGSSDVFHQLNAGGTAEVVPETLFLDLRTTVSQQNVSVLGPQADSNINITGNRQSVRTSLISPVVRHEFGSDALLEARLSYSTVDTDSVTGALLDSQATGFDLKLRSGATSRLLAWNAAYTRQHIDYKDALVRDIDIDRIQAGAKRLITSDTSLLATIGYEDNRYLTSGSAPKGAFWNVGSEWTPSPRTRLTATVGRNYDGTTGALDFSHCTRLSTWGVSYTQDLATARAQTLLPGMDATAGRVEGLLQCTITDPAARQAAVASFLSQYSPPASFGTQVGFTTSVPYLQKRLQGSMGIHGVRNTLFLNLYRQTRDARGPVDQPGAGDFAQNGNNREAGASALWTTRLTTQVASNLSVGIVRNEFVGTGVTDTRKYARLNITRTFNPRVSGTLGLRRLLDVSTNGRASYAENAVSAALIVKF